MASKPEGACTECNCGPDTYKSNPFKREFCKACNHKHTPQPKKDKAPVKKWEIATESSFKFDFSSNPTDITKIDWSKATGVEKSSGGSQGVFFVSTPDGAAVVKGSMTIGSEVFSSVVAAKLGINAPKCRIVEMTSGEGESMYNKLVELDSLQPIMRTVASALNRKYLLIMEFVKGTALAALTAKSGAEFFGNEDTLSEMGRVNLTGLGEVLAFDMVMHNTDRLPLVVDNRGNAGNVMFSTVKGHRYGELVAIDNGVMCIDCDKNIDTLTTYSKSVAKLLTFLKETPDKLSPNCKKMRDSIMEHTGFDIDQCAGPGTDQKLASGSMEIQKGIISFLRKTDKLTVEDLLSIKRSIGALGSEMVGLSDIRSDYLHVMLTLCRRRGDTSGYTDMADFIKTHAGQAAKFEKSDEESKNDAGSDGLAAINKLMLHLTV